MEPRNVSEHPNGFTLIEVLASIVLLGIIFVIFYQLVGFTALSKDRESRKDGAIQLANETLQETLASISAAENTPAAGSQNENKTGSNGMSILINETSPEQDVPPPSGSKSEYVSVAAITLLSDGDNIVPRKLVVTVRWKP